VIMRRETLEARLERLEYMRLYEHWQYNDAGLLLLMRAIHSTKRDLRAARL
jgi:hypothetical protein